MAEFLGQWNIRNHVGCKYKCWFSFLSVQPINAVESDKHKKVPWVWEEKIKFAEKEKGSHLELRWGL